MNKIIERIEREAGVPGLASILAERLTPTDLQSLMLEVYRQRSSGRGYYQDLCFHIQATHASGKRLELVDGGSVDWTQKYLSNAKERLVISGIGSERLCTEFGGSRPAG